MTKQAEETNKETSKITKLLEELNAELVNIEKEREQLIANFNVAIGALRGRESAAKKYIERLKHIEQEDK